MNMRCPTIEVNRDGEKVIINLSDFDDKIMTKWVDKITETEIIDNSTLLPLAPPPPISKK